MSRQHEEHQAPDIEGTEPEPDRQEDQPAPDSCLTMTVYMIVFLAGCLLLLRYVAVPVMIWLETNTHVIGLLFFLGWGMVILWGVLAAIRLIAAIIEAILRDED